MPLNFPLFCDQFFAFKTAADYVYRKVANSNMSRFEAHAGFFRLSKKGIFNAYVL